jgi:hypothetical protein
MQLIKNLIHKSGIGWTQKDYTDRIFIEFLLQDSLLTLDIRNNSIGYTYKDFVGFKAFGMILNSDSVLVALKDILKALNECLDNKVSDLETLRFIKELLS